MRTAARRQKAPKLTLTQQRAKRATRLRAQLLLYRERHGLTWEELQALMANKGFGITIATLKRFGLAYTTPHVHTASTVEKFLATMRAFDKVGPGAEEAEA